MKVGDLALSADQSAKHRMQRIMKEEAIERKSEIGEILKEMDLLLYEDLSHDSLGSANGFHSAQDAKNQLLNFAKTLLEDTLELEFQQNPVIARDALVRIKSAITKIRNTKTKIDELASQGVHETSFPKLRKENISKIEDEKNSFLRDLYPYELDLRSAKLQSFVNEKQFFDQAKEEAEDALLQIERTASQVEKVLNNLQGKATARGVESSTEQFGALLDHHKKYERNWLLATAASALALLCAVAYAFVYDIESFSDGDRVVHALSFLKRIFLISVPAVFLRLFIGKYNAERELRIVYGHRETVLNQYRHFEAGIGDDQEAKNQFRLEIAKYIFSDPRTNYSDSNSDGKAININPVVSAIERVTDTK